MAEDLPDLDDTDLRIIRALNENARRSYRDIARDLDIALSTVSAHVKKLEKADVIQGYIPLVDPTTLGYELTVLVGIRIAHGAILDVQESIAQDPHTYGVYDVTGEWDSMVLARFRDRQELNTFIKEVVSMEHVERTSTQIVLNTMKEEHRVHVPDATEDEG